MTVTRNAVRAAVAATALGVACGKRNAGVSAPPDAEQSVPIASNAPATSAPAANAPRRHVILIIGDGMQLEHEIAASRYLYGTDDGMSWHRFPYQGYCSTWDIDAYDAYAAAAGARPYAPDDFDPRLGYDPARGGVAPYPIASPRNCWGTSSRGQSGPPPTRPRPPRP